MRRITNKQAIAPLFIILFIALILIGIYFLLYLPIPSFKKIKAVINYFSIIMVWFLIQAGLIFAYVKIGKLATRGFIIAKRKITRWSFRINNYIAMRS